MSTLSHWINLSLALSVFLARPASAAEPAPLPAKLWDAVIVANEVEVPFRLELSTRGGQLEGAFFNGDERVRSTDGSLVDDKLILRFDHYAGTLEVKLAEGKLSGSYGRAGQAAYPFRAQPFVARAAGAGKVPSIAGNWEIHLESPKGEAAWSLYIRQSGAEVSAAILRVDGDTGVLSGSYRDGKFVLSHFSGARPNLFELTLGADGALSVVQNGKATYRAIKRADARAQKLPEPADPSRWTSVKDPSAPLHFSARDLLTGATVTEADPRFVGKVVLLNVMGSWCPNCHDEAPFLQALYRKYHKRGLEVVALSFEDAEQLRDPARLRAFIKTYGVEYQILLGGEPKEIGSKLPDAVKLNTWPATFFIGRDGLVRGAHAGFAGKATGPAHDRLKAELTRQVEKLLAEKVAPAGPTTARR